jgi:hypothetical protein
LNCLATFPISALHISRVTFDVSQVLLDVGSRVSEWSVGVIMPVDDRHFFTNDCVWKTVIPKPTTRYKGCPDEGLRFLTYCCECIHLPAVRSSEVLEHRKVVAAGDVH